MTEKREIQEYKDSLSEKILSAFPEQPEPAQQIDDLLKVEEFTKTLRISQIDIIDILSQPKPDSTDVADLIEEYGLQQNKTRPRRTRKAIEERLKPYGISHLLWQQYHDDHYDAFDFPLVPKRSLSIPIEKGLSGAWAPNGYGKTFVFAHVLKILKAYQHEEIELHEDNEHELFSDFLTKCTAYLHHPNQSTIPLPYDGQLEETLDKRLIPFRQICFSVEALKNNHATEFFSIRIEMEYDSRGNVSNYSLHLLAPNVDNTVVVEGNIKLPNWINSNYHLEQISYTDLSSRGGNYSKWPGIALRKLLSLNVNYIEIPSLAYQPTAAQFVQQNIEAIVNNLLEDFTQKDYPDIEIDKHGLLSQFSKEGGNRFLIGALNDLYNSLNQEEEVEAAAQTADTVFGNEELPEEAVEAAAHTAAQAATSLAAHTAIQLESLTRSKDSGINALRTLIDNFQIIENEINALVNNDNESWGIKAKIRTPIGINALDIIDRSSKKILPWKHLSFGQRNDLIFQSTLIQYQHCYNANNTKEQVVLVIDEPEAGRSESWVNQLMHKLSTHNSTHPILILSHRGMVLESINPSGEYQIMHTAKPDFDEVDEEAFKDYGTLQSELSSKAKQSFVFISAIDQEHNSRWGIKFPDTFTPTEEWMEFEPKSWILKPTSLTMVEIAHIKKDISRFNPQFSITNQELFLCLWNGRTWTNKDAQVIRLHNLVQKEPLIDGEIVAKSRVKGIHVGGLGLPRTPELNFLLTHLPIQYPKDSNEVHTTYRNKTIKQLALTNGLKISNTRISNVRKIIALAEQQEDGPDRFSKNLQMFVAGLKVRLDNLPAATADAKDKRRKGKANMPTKKTLQTYILQLENKLEHQDEINEPQPATGPHQQFTEEGFFGYLKTLGLKMPEQPTQSEAQTPEKTDLEKLKNYSKLVRKYKPPEKQKELANLTEMLSQSALQLIQHKKWKKPENYPNMDKIKLELRLRDTQKHPTQANFDTTKYRWTQKTLTAAITEAEINDYAEEFVLHLASRYADENDIDPDAKIWIRADAFKKAAREIADRDVSSRIYDDFDDECGQYMLIRADIHGYSCLTCESMYDEKKFLI